MARAFPEDQRNNIRSALISTGSRLFTQQGLRKTSVDELVHIVGIAKGSFYNFFESKEDLCFAILHEEGQTNARKLADAASSKQTGADGLSKYLSALLLPTESNKLLTSLLHRGELELLASKVNPARLADHYARDGEEAQRVLATFLGYRARQIWSSKVVGGLFRALSLAAEHKEEIGTDILPDVVSVLSQLIAKGIEAELAQGEKNS